MYDCISEEDWASASLENKINTMNNIFFNTIKVSLIPLQKVAIKLDVSASLGVNPESAG